MEMVTQGGANLSIGQRRRHNAQETPQEMQVRLAPGTRDQQAGPGDRNAEGTKE